MIEHESTAQDELMAFRLLHYVVSLSHEHLRQGHKKLPIILPLCLYHGEKSPYPHSTDFYDCFEDPTFARKVAFKPFKLIDLTVIPDEEIERDGLASLMEMLFKHYRAKNFLTIFNQKIEFIRDIAKQLDKEYRQFVIKYLINGTRDEEQPNAVEQLIQNLITIFPEEKGTIMTFSQQLEAKGFTVGIQKGMLQGMQEGMQEGMKQGIQKSEKSIERIMQSKGFDKKTIEEILTLSRKECEQEKA